MKIRELVEKMGKLFKAYSQKLYMINYNDISFRLQNDNISFIRIDDNNLEIVKNLSGSKNMKQFKQQLSKGDIGIYVCIDNYPVGYGWLKNNKASDFFYNIGSVNYLCRFFVKEEYRGRGLYPAMIVELANIGKEVYGNLRFFISVESNNISSERGIKKVGFSFIEHNKFIRILKITLNKKNLD